MNHLALAPVPAGEGGCPLIAPGGQDANPAQDPPPAVGQQLPVLGRDIEAYDVFARAAATGALKVVLTRGG